MKFQIQKLKTGFTLIEMLVSIFIVALISGLFLINYRSANRISSLNNAAEKLVSDIRTAQNNSLGSKDFNNNSPVGGWGINFNGASTTYIIFANVDGDCKTVGGVFSDCRYNDPSEIFQSIKLPPLVVINSIAVIDLNGTNSVSNADIIFLPPDPQTLINKYASGDNNTDIRITLRETASNATKIIEVNSFGLISITQ